MNTISTKLMGGLGNYMFQIATAYAVSLRDKKKLVCETYDIQSPQKPLTNYTGNIFSKIEFTNDLIPYIPYGEGPFSFREIPQVEGNLRLYGYFQSEKYFETYRQEIIELFEFGQETQQKIITKYKEVLEKKPTSIHVRRGEYVWLNDFHQNQDLDYYRNAIDIVGNDTDFLIFSDDISWCEENFEFVKNKTFVSGNEDFEELFLMTQCANNIIANSSFSWWGAWLNTNENKKVIAPHKWFGKSNSHIETKDLYCEKWIVI